MVGLKKISNKIKDTLLKLHVTESDFHSVLADIRYCNLRVLKATSFIVSILFFILLSYVGGPDEFLDFNYGIYLYLSLSSFFVFVLTLTLLKKYKKFVIFADYLFVANCFIYGIIVGVFNQPEHFAASFNAIIVIFPILFIDKTKRMVLFLFVFETVFCYFSIKTKALDMAKMDVVNSLSFCLVSVGLCIYMNHMRIVDFLLRQSIKNERDCDGLTAVLNKAAFNREISKLFNDRSPDGVLYIIDVDNFKSVNDNFGHNYGDELLQKIASCIKLTFRNSDLIGRFGGDEFIVFMKDANSDSLAEEKARLLVNTVNSTVPIKNERSATVSVGCTMSVTESETYDIIFKRADKALYKAKKSGKNTYIFEK